MPVCINETSDEFDDCICFAFFPNLAYTFKKKPLKWSIWARNYVRKQADKYFQFLKCTNPDHARAIRHIVVQNFDVLALIYPDKIRELEDYKLPRKCKCHNQILNECWFAPIDTSIDSEECLNKMVLRTEGYQSSLYF